MNKKKINFACALGALALVLPVFVLMLSGIVFRQYSLLAVGCISQVLYLAAIRMLEAEYKNEINKLKTE